MRREERAVGELAVAVGVLGGVGDRVVQRLVHEGDVAALLGQDGERGGHVAADRVAGDRQACVVEPSVSPSLHDPLRRGVGLLDRDRVLGFGGSVVLDEHNCGVRTDGQFADETIVGAGVAEDPAAAVDVQDRREQEPVGADGLDDADLNVADVGRDR